MNWLKTDVKKRIIFGFTIEAVMTNIMSANNVLALADQYEAKKVVVLSTE